MLKVSKRTLLLVAGIVWCLAGGNIAWLGIQEFVQVDSNMCWLLGSFCCVPYNDFFKDGY